jgi:hypothetical protein
VLTIHCKSVAEKHWTPNGDTSSVILLRNRPFSIFTSLPIGDYLLWLAASMTLYSVIEYIMKNKKLLLQQDDAFTR